MILDDKYKTAEEIRKYTGLITLAIVPMESADVMNGRGKSGNAGRVRRDSGRRKT